LESGIHTGDFGDKSIPSVNTTTFAETIIANFGKQPANSPRPIQTDHPSTCTVFHLDHNPMLESVDDVQEKIDGVDFFIESNLQPEDLAQICLRHGGLKYKLVSISNRGTQVWPTGSVYTNLVNQYNIRFEGTDQATLRQNDVVSLYASLSGDFKVCSLELLNSWGAKKGYSLAQGQ
jgi:isocitrate dehydrogenase